MSRLITIVLPMCLGFLFSNSLRKGNYEGAIVAIIGLAACLTLVVRG